VALTGGASGRAREGRVGPLLLLGVAVLGAAVTVHAVGWDDVGVLRRAAARSGASGAVVFAAGYAGLTLTPLPKNALSTTAGLVFGFSTGLLVVWCGAVTGAMIAFGLARWLDRGRDRVGGGRLERLDRLLARHGLLGSVLVRLVPVLPFTAINYGSGLTALPLRHYAVGTAIGILPGSVVFVGLGAGAVLLPL
jgi:uncharacterized membrane protein YdjX (TVP38/TMEM64 family)